MFLTGRSIYEGGDVWDCLTVVVFKTQFSSEGWAAAGEAHGRSHLIGFLKMQASLWRGLIRFDDVAWNGM